jgi:hypothetical protein
MAVDHQRTERRTLKGLRRKETQEASNKDPPPPQYNQRGGASNRGRGHGRGPYTLKPPYCRYYGSEINHGTKDCPIFLKTKKKKDQETTQPLSQLPPREVNHTMQWNPHHQQYSLSYPSLFPPQTYQNSIAKLWPITNLTTMPSLTILNLRQFHKLPIPPQSHKLHTLHKTAPMPTKSKLSQIHLYLHLRNYLRTSPLMAPYSQSPKV